MSWSQIHNHQAPLARFRRSVESGRLASTYLFVGPPGVGKRTFAMKLAQALLCQTNEESQLEPCGHCSDCQQVAAGAHPDLILVSKPKDKAYIPVQTFIGDKEHRRQRGLCHDIGLKPFRGGRKIAIIDDADFLNAESANSLLKTLEEPPPRSLLILIGTSEQRQLSTIVSRSQVIRFSGLQSSEIRTLLDGAEFPEGAPPLESLALASEGSIELALVLSDPEAFEFRSDLLAQLASHDPGSGNFSKSITTFVEAAGKDGAQKRSRMARVGDFSIGFYRFAMARLSGTAAIEEPLMADQVERFVTNLDAGAGVDVNDGCAIASLCIERTMTMQRQVASNVNAANAVASWLADIGRICRRVNVPSVAML